MAKYVITSACEIDIVGGLIGPIATPIELTRSQVIKLLNDNISVYQVNPFDINERVKVTFDNYDKITFARKRAKITTTRLLNRSVRESNTIIQPKHKDTSSTKPKIKQGTTKKEEPVKKDNEVKETSEPKQTNQESKENTTLNKSDFEK